MAIYHLHVKSISRGLGSAKSKAEYIAREGRYQADSKEVSYSEHGNMPKWAEDAPKIYWETADTYERANGRLFVHIEFSLPVELNQEQQTELAKNFCQTLASTSQGQKLPYSMAIHKGKGANNPHCHLMINERINDNIERLPSDWFKRANQKNLANGGAVKAEELRSKLWLQNTRKLWADMANSSLKKYGKEVTIDHRTLADQGIDREPQYHLGPAAAAMERKNNAKKENKEPITSRGKDYYNHQKIEVMEKELEELKLQKEEGAKASTKTTDPSIHVLKVREIMARFEANFSKFAVATSADEIKSSAPRPGQAEEARRAAEAAQAEEARRAAEAAQAEEARRAKIQKQDIKASRWELTDEAKAKNDAIKKLQTEMRSAWQEKNWEKSEKIAKEIKTINESRFNPHTKPFTVAAAEPSAMEKRAGVSPAEKPDTPPPAWLQAAQAFEAAQDNRAQGEAALTAFALELKKLQKEYDEQAQAAKNLEDKIFWTERNLGSARHALAEAPGKKYLDAQAAHTEREAKEARAAEQQECELLPPKYKKMAEAGALPEVPEKWGLFELAGTKKSVRDYISSKKRAERAEEAAARARNQKEARWNEKEEQAEKVTTLEQELTRMKAGLRTEQATAVRLEQKVKTGKEDLKKYQARADQQWPDRVREREEEKKLARQRSQGMGR